MCGQTWDWRQVNHITALLCFDSERRANNIKGDSIASFYKITTNINLENFDPQIG